MDLKIVAKVGKNYQLRKINIIENAGKRFFEELLITVDKQLKNIREDIISFSDIDKEVNLKKPSHPSWEIQKKLDKLTELRKLNLDLKESLKNLLRESEFIICEHCGSKMYKRPLGVPIKKIGKIYVALKEISDTTYDYSCSNDDCHYCIQAYVYEKQDKLKRLKEDLIRDGYNYVPNDLGFWHKLNDGKPMNKSPMFSKDEGTKAWEREYETIKIKGKKSFIKIKETCEETGEIRDIK